MNDNDFAYLQQRVAEQMQQAAQDAIATILVDFAILPKRALYPTLANLLGLECECRGLECKGCDAVEEWLMELCDEETGE